MLRICLLSSKHKPTDIRVFTKEGCSLAAAGYDVVHLAPGTEPSRVEDGVRLEVYRAGGSIKDRLFSMFRLYRRAAKVNADVYHCNEVDSWAVGVALRVLRKKKVVFDVHEHYPSTFGRLHCPRWARGLAAGTLRAFFRMLIPWTDRFVLAKKTVAEDYPGAEDRTVVVANYASLLNERESDPVAEKPTGDSVTAIHTGLISRDRGWPQLLEALRQTKAPGLRLKIVGTCTDPSDEDFRRAIGAADIKDRVEFYDWMPFEKLIEHMEASHIGLILFQANVQNNIYAMPHKMFDYMKARLPVIMPHFAVEVAPIIEEEQCGILLDPSSPTAIAEALDTLSADPELRVKYGKNGRRAVFNRYNWEKEAERLVEMYRGIEAELANA